MNLPDVQRPRSPKFDPPPKFVPAAYSFRAVINEHFRRNGGSITEAIVSAYTAIKSAADAGDWKAGVALLDRFCGKEEIQVSGKDSKMLIVLDTGVVRGDAPEKPRLAITVAEDAQFDADAATANLLAEIEESEAGEDE